MRSYDLFSALRKKDEGEGQSNLPVSAVFSYSFSLKYSRCQGATFRGSMSSTHQLPWLTCFGIC